ncbi:MAG: DUF748 domain-containing protein [Polaromonas sp.]
MSRDAFKNKWQVRGKTLWSDTKAVLGSPQWQRRVAWAIGVWLVLWALAYAAVPFILKSQLEKIGSEKLGRQLTVGAVDFKPWTLELTLHDLAIAKAGSAGVPESAGLPARARGSAPPALQPPAVPPSSQLKIRRLYIDAELQSLLRLAPVADALVVEDPVLSLTYLGEGRYDIDDILERFKKPDPPPASEPPQFALYNLLLSGGQMDFVDQSVRQTHELCDLRLAVPFLSNLPSQREINITPHLAFTLNGSSFDTAAEGTPFARTHKTDANFTLRGLDLKPYLAYWPASLPFRLQSAVLHADAKVAFEQTSLPIVRISGSVTADKVSLLQAVGPGASSAAGPELLAFDRLHITLDDVRPLEQVVKLSAVELSAPTLSITRDRAGRLNLLPADKQEAAKNMADGERPASAPRKIDAKVLATLRKVQLARVDVKGPRSGSRWSAPAAWKLNARVSSASGSMFQSTPKHRLSEFGRGYPSPK